MPTVLVLGAASDMAVAIVKHMAPLGYSFQLAARNANRLEALKSDIGIRFNASATLHEFDALDFASHVSFYKSLPVTPDITICVIGYLGDPEKAATDWSEAARILHTNYTGAVSILNVVAADYSEKKKGVIVGISSVAGERGRQSNYLYGSAKAGFTAYLSGLRNKLFQSGVHVVSVQPGFVFTSMTAHLTLPPLLTATPEIVANTVYKAIQKKKDVVYVKWFWRWIMLIIKCIPEFIFKKLKL
ncbi:MAG: SDR family oxidoreductase [Chitinophagaceae bacterium]|nr:SDR family oxidoreductase [Chitinophagaceae bacterium]